MRVVAWRWFLSLLLLGGLSVPAALAVGLKETATLETLRIDSNADGAEFSSGSSGAGGARRLSTLIGEAIDDVIAMPVPRDKFVLKMRLQIFLEGAREFAPEQRQSAAQYAVKIWRAAGFTEQSRLLSVSDQEMLKFEGKK